MTQTISNRVSLHTCMCKSSRDIKGYDKCETQRGNKTKARQTLQYHPGQLLFPEKGRKSCPGVGFEPTTLCSPGKRCIFLQNYYMLLTALKLLFIRIMKCSIIAYVHLEGSTFCLWLFSSTVERNWRTCINIHLEVASKETM